MKNSKLRSHIIKKKHSLLTSSDLVEHDDDKISIDAQINKLKLKKRASLFIDPETMARTLKRSEAAISIRDSINSYFVNETEYEKKRQAFIKEL